MTRTSAALLAEHDDASAMGEASPKRAPRRVRRTQAERSADTRERACQATLDALVDLGYERISTQEIARRAGLSRGALTHQFPTRNSLIIAAYDWLVRSWEANEPFTWVTGGSDRRLDFTELADLLWVKIFRTERYIATLELMLAARKDEAIGTGIRQIMVRWTRLRDRLTAELLGLSPDDPTSATFVQLNLCVLRGIAVHKSFETEPDSAERLIAEWKRILATVEPTRTTGAGG
ncbi:TetR/AcrR family transcriptional regulator [Acuticoccus sp. M5D2P5]|uniref:TetR/AcrR family transcriptional regulator n=1 Tax=Acuticoccus kalidii TaxID=2910977 RepID=UPI001F37D4BD|nr:TetR/AcrR family transcriptional regulator [Acuticoccus kalidii]MCF3933136.1 TetR/AcrR family transcriptional regulator [Acuticoccus kalidii]